MSSLVSNHHKINAQMLTQEIRRVLGLPPLPPNTTVDKVDWELCSDIEIWADKMREERESAEQQNNSLKRKRLPTPDSEDEDEDGIVVARPTHKKPRVAISTTSNSLSRDNTQEEPVADVPALGSFSRMSIDTDTLEDFPAGGARLSRIQRRDRERQNFIIWEDRIVEDSDGALANYGLSMTSWTPTQPGDEKENQPPEYDMAPDEFISEYDEYYYVVEEVHQHESRAVLSEIQIENQI
ncbi:hypothetical protein UA08_06532 [Talaromyces atroroseus]|uniref:Uncharacterized protein n=1 Tax=Talaromyces atroroseus TaxID=1441469 RepID=A0A225AB95_TALAT|nr:hypothetical protein UA08_06532 [Talaromyces atroroseus]OKL58222.1 hypothetical protein UA08_06532 [Talaromyces atroroseus]